jgi:hypothetical protein
METPLQRTLRIGKITVGLIGLDVALNQLADKEITEEDAVRNLFEHVSKFNYVPEQAIPEYKKALLREFKRFRDQEKSDSQGLTIRILGPPCVTCNKLKTTLIDILQEKELAADIEDINDLDEIWRHGVIKTPALIINGVVKSAGVQPPRFQLEKWIEEAAKD